MVIGYLHIPTHGSGRSPQNRTWGPHHFGAQGRRWSLGRSGLGGSHRKKFAPFCSPTSCGWVFQFLLIFINTGLVRSFHSSHSVICLFRLDWVLVAEQAFLLSPFSPAAASWGYSSMWARTLHGGDVSCCRAQGSRHAGFSRGTAGSVAAAQPLELLLGTWGLPRPGI